jgi:hypothetical protein
MSGSIHQLAACLDGVERRKITFGFILKIREIGDKIKLAQGRV